MRTGSCARRFAGRLVGMGTETMAECESCGDEGKVTEVRRVYVTPADWDTESKITPADDTEQWCDACVLHYPHQPV